MFGNAVGPKYEEEHVGNDLAWGLIDYAFKVDKELEWPDEHYIMLAFSQIAIL